MIYRGEFTSLKGNDYRIEFFTRDGNDNKVSAVKLSGDPLTTSVEEGDGGLYAPIRCGGATVRLLVDEPILDLYSGEAQGVEVTVARNGELIWGGYVSPTIYDQGFDGELEELEVDCVDAIAVLKNMPYRSEKKEVLTFLDIIRKILRRAGFFRWLYISDNVQLASGRTEAICERLRVSENNFFGDKDDASQGDDDVAWSCYEVLEELMRWLGYTLITEGQEVYCIDYDAARGGEQGFWRYDVLENGDHTGTRVSRQWGHHITASSYAESGTKVSMDRVYNKVTVADDFRSMETLFPTFGDEAFEDNITAASDPDAWTYVKRPATVAQTVDGKSDNFQIFTTEERGTNYLAAVKFYRSDVFRFHRYKGTSTPRFDYTEQFEKEARLSAFFSSAGAAYMKIFKKELSSDEYKRLDKMFVDAGDPSDDGRRAEIYKDFFNIEDLGSLNFEPQIVFNNPRSSGVWTHVGPSALNRTGKYDKVSGEPGNLEDSQQYPCVTLRENLPEGIFGGADSYLLIKGDYIQHDRTTAPFDIGTKNNSSLGREGDLKLEDELFFWAKLEWGGKWLSETGWTDKESFFKIFWRKGQGNIHVKTYFSARFELRDNSLAKFFADEKGVIVPSPKLQGSPKLTIYMNRDSRGRSKRGDWTPKDGNYYDRYYNEMQILENFAIETKTNAGGIAAESELLTDTVYTNETGNGSVEEMDEITFRVCTYDGKSPSYSTVDYIGEDGYSIYADAFYNRALNSREGTPMRQEEHMVFKCVTQYENPRLIFECNLRNGLMAPLYGILTDQTLSGRTFVIISRETDWRMEKTNLKLLEKA